MSSQHPLAAHPQLRAVDLAGVTQVNTDGVDERWRSWWTLDPRPDLAYRPSVDIDPTTVELVLPEGRSSPLLRALVEATHGTGVGY